MKKISTKSRKGMSGFSIIEALIAIGLVAGVGMTLATIQEQSSKAMQAANLQQTAQELKAKMLQALQDQKAWDATINAAANDTPFDCVQNQTSCTGIGDVTPIEFTLFDSTGAAMFSNYTTGASAQPGFDAKGRPCATFNDATTGDSGCVFGVKVERKVLCVGTCKNPQISINIRLAYRPLDDKPLVVLDKDKYSVIGFVRGAKSLTKSFSISHQISNNFGIGGGACAASVLRPWTTIDSNSFSLVSVTSPDVTFLSGGTYKCRATAAGFGVDGFSISLKEKVSGTVLASSTAVAPQWLQTTASIDTIVTVPTNMVLQLEQNCQSFVNPAGFGLGVATNPYGGNTTLATLVCSQLN